MTEDMPHTQSPVIQTKDFCVMPQPHPVHDCPEDILIMIFEETVHFDENEWFRTATTLSHVNRRWRAVALQTSFLWSRIDISMDTDNIKDLQDFLARTRLCLGSTPAIITISDIHKHDELWDSFTECLNLNRFPRITELDLWLWSYPNFTELFYDSFGYSNGPIDRLLIARDTGLRERGEIIQDCTCIFRSFPTARNITFQDLNSIEITGNDLFPTVLGLSFHDVRVAMDVMLELYRFPNLTEFSLTDARQVSSVSEDIMLPNLVKMEIISATEFPWHQLYTPRLRSLEFDDELADVVPFLRRHTSLKRVDCSTWLNYSEIKTLSNEAGGAEEVGIYGNVERFLTPASKNPFPFPNVTHLKLYFKKDIGLSLQAFEKLVRSRCLQSDIQYACLGAKRIEILGFEGLVEAIDEQPWRKSSLLIHFDESLTRTHNADTVCTLSLKLKGL